LNDTKIDLNTTVGKLTVHTGSDSDKTKPKEE